MIPLPAYTAERAWRLSLVALLAAVLFAFHAPLLEMVEQWRSKADYSHGFFVIPFAVYLLWVRRAIMPRNADWPDWRGLAPILAGIAISFAAGVTNKAKEISQGLGLILALGGVIVMMFGRYSLKWAWPGLVFLIFMVKMPDAFEVKFALKLRQLASQGSNLVLQTLGYPSYVTGQYGTVITINDLRLGVEWACSGLSMVLTFIAVATAYVLLTNRPKLDKAVILFSAIPIAVLSNIIRITITALAYTRGWQKLGDALIHDFAGWLMMPMALGFLWIEVKLLDWLFTTPEPPERDDIIKTATQTAAANWQMPAEGPQGGKR